MVNNEYKSMVLTIPQGCVIHTRMIETYSNVNACMVRMVHTMIGMVSYEGLRVEVLRHPSNTYSFGCAI